MQTNQSKFRKSIIYGPKRFTLIEGSCDIPRTSILSLISELDPYLTPGSTTLVVGRLTTRGRDAMDVLEAAAVSAIAIDWDTVAFAAGREDMQILDLLAAARMRPVAIFAIEDTSTSKL